MQHTLTALGNQSVQSHHLSIKGETNDVLYIKYDCKT